MFTWFWYPYNWRGRYC